MRELFPIPRSLTGHGVRRDARRARPRAAARGRRDADRAHRSSTGRSRANGTCGRRGSRRRTASASLDVADSPLHVLGYSAPVDAVVPLERAAAARLHASRRIRTSCPYRTSYWEEQWGFCMSRRQLDSLADGNYRVRDRRRPLEDGSLTSGEVTLPGATRGGVSAQHLRLPSRARERQPLGRRRALGARAHARAAAAAAHVPPALEPRHARAALLARPQPRPARPRRATASSSRASAIPGPLRYKRSRRGDAPIDRAAAHVLGGEPARASSATGSRRAATSASSARPASTFRSARSRGRRTGSSRSTTPRPTTSRSSRRTRSPASFRAALADHRRRRDERPLPEPLAVRRAAARTARPLPERPRRDEPRARRTCGCSASPTALTTCSRSPSARVCRTSPSAMAAATLEEHGLLERLP